jgi:putative Mn2+ efflux pump MntP
MSFACVQALCVTIYQCHLPVPFANLPVSITSACVQAFCVTIYQSVICFCVQAPAPCSGHRWAQGPAGNLKEKERKH